MRDREGAVVQAGPYRHRSLTVAALKMTGGETFLYNYINLQGMQQILEKMRAAAAAEYAAGFVPSPSAAGPRQHHLEVRLASRKTGRLVGGKRSIVY